MATSKPLVSVIMPAYNGEKFIQESIESVLAQTYDKFELIIIEDHSTDRTLEIIKNYSDPRIHLFVNERNKGISYSTNLGTKYCHGKYIALLDDDDIALSRRLEWQVDYLEKHPEIDVLGGRSAKIDENGEFMYYALDPIRNAKLIKANLLFYNRKFANGTVMYRKQFVIDNNIYYKENMYGMQDYKFYTECANYGSIATIDQLIHLKRIHTKEATKINQKNYELERKQTYLEIQKSAIESRGFRLSNEEYKILAEVLYDVIPKSFDVETIQHVFCIFNKIIKQAEKMNIEYLEELKLACKKIIGERIITRADIFH